VDDSKWGQVAPYTFLRLEQVSHVITNAGAPSHLVGEVRALGVDVIVVKA
jgi:DeoR/GlpR family transcriptional regulator of sugar metabolism